ncbi:MAG: HAMP domain-containing sensor histidine kinase [Candidatus Omnitrophota bacterium]|nr:HAMP domain-containing sensor histidine kinase [Candidatus Omnitrophota bacterium]
MEKKKDNKRNEYKVVMSDLGTSPFRTIRIAFALMAVIPLLVVFYVIVGKNFLYRIFLGNDGLAVSIAIIVSLIGLSYAYELVNRLTEKLLKYAAERKTADSEKTELLMAVTHDLKTPIAAIKLGIQNLMDGIGGTLTKLQGDIAKSCLNAIESVSKFIEEVANFSKTGLMRMHMKRELIDLSNLITKEVDSIKRIAQQNELQIEFKQLTDNASLWADENKISRVVTNLLSNAVKYTPRGGRIETVVSSDENTVKFSVINTGPGIPSSELDKVFKKYERLAMHSDIAGVGIGLSIVKDIVDLHQGRITVKSEPNKETEFSVILPRDLRMRGGVVNAKK